MARPRPVTPDTLPGFDSFEDLMALAMEQAKKAGEMDEVPVGAVIISPEGEVIARASNAPITSGDPTAHAEIRCIRKAAEKLDNYRLTGCIMAVTLEPCLMCLGAIVHSRISGLIYATPDPRTGVIESQLKGTEFPFFNHYFWTKGDVLANESATLLQNFFRSRREKKKTTDENSLTQPPQDI